MLYTSDIEVCILVTLKGVDELRAQSVIVWPCQFVTQCVTIWETPVKQTHISQITLIKTLAKISCQPRCQLFQQGLSVACPYYTMLFMLHNLLTYEPATIPFVIVPLPSAIFHLLS